MLTLVSVVPVNSVGTSCLFVSASVRQLLVIKESVVN